MEVQGISNYYNEWHIRLNLMRFDFDESGRYEGSNDGEDDEPEGKVEEGVFVREHVEEGGEPGVELVEGPDGGLLTVGVVDPALETVLLRVRVTVVGVVVEGHLLTVSLVTDLASVLFLCSKERDKLNY